MQKVEQQLKGDVVSIRHTLDYDSTGEPAVYLRIVVPDELLVQNRLLATTRHIEFAIEQELQPQDRWGVYPYYRFRSESEQRIMREPAWA